LIELNRGFAYQGEECREEGNCIGNTNCQANKCECKQGYTPKNGVCCMLKSILFFKEN